MRSERRVCLALMLVLLGASHALGQKIEAVAGSITVSLDAVRPEGFHAVLLLAKNTPGAMPTELPGGVAKALKEASELLPFKSYQVQDQAWLRSNGAPIHKIHLLGPLSRDYELFLELKNREAQKVSVAVSLTYTSVETKGQTEVLSTEFSARLGETVVVGTSRVKGDESLVLLITPLAPRAGSELSGRDTREVIKLRCEVTKDGKVVVADAAVNVWAGQSGGIGLGDGLKLALTPNRMDAHKIMVSISASRGSENGWAVASLVDTEEDRAGFTLGGSTYTLRISVFKPS